MKNITKKLFTGLAVCMPIFAFACGNFNAKFNFPIVLNVDGQKHVCENAFLSADCYPNVRPFIELTENPDGKSTFGNIYKNFKENDIDGMGRLLASKNDAKRAIKFIEMMDFENAILQHIIALEGNKHIAIFSSPSSKLRQDMNFFLFKEEDDKLLWDISAKSNLITMFLESARFSEPVIGDKNKDGLQAEYIDLTEGKNADNPAFVFYKAAQKEFYDMKLDEYAKFMTPQSRAVYAKQFLEMSKEEQTEALKDYILWQKIFFGVYDTGKVKVIVFKRTKECAAHEMYDCAFIVETEDGLKLANFGQNQGAFADYVIERAKAMGQ